MTPTTRSGSAAPTSSGTDAHTPDCVDLDVLHAEQMKDPNYANAFYLCEEIARLKTALYRIAEWDHDWLTGDMANHRRFSSADLAAADACAGCFALSVLGEVPAVGGADQGLGVGR